MSDPFDRIAELNAALHFCEDCAASLPVDRAQDPGAGPLAGRIIGLKSNIRVKGQAWTAGIGARAAHVAQTDAPLVATLRAAGARVLSRLAMDEGALGAATDNPHFGRCENPAYPGHSAGGSSGGSAAAVAAGAVDAALGSDTMGSVRIPAAYCGVFGLKFGAGVVPMDGVMPLAPSLDALGLFARSPAMLRQVLEVLDPPETSVAITGWCAPDTPLIETCTPEVRAAYAAAHTALQDRFGPPEPCPTPDLEALRADAFLLTEIEAVASLGQEVGLSPGLAKLVDYGRKMTPEIRAALRDRLDAARDALRSALGRSRVLLLPTVAEPAFAHGARPPVGQADFTALANIAGLPALAIPKAGALPPVSVQIVGPDHSERALIALAERLGPAL